MSMTHAEHPSAETAASYGGLVDAIGGIATVVLAIVALSGVHPNIIFPITVIVFGAALLIQGGTMLSEYTRVIFPPAAGSSAEQFGGGGLSALFLVGVAGMVLGVLALLNIQPVVLSAIAVIAFGGALVISSNSVRNLYLMRSNSTVGETSGAGGEMLAGEMASGSAGVQLLAGLAAIVLGILAVAGVYADVLSLAALLVLGATVILTGSTLTGVVQSLMPSTARETVVR